MHFSRIAAAAATGAIVMSLAAGTAKSAELVVLSTISAKEALIELVPEFEHASVQGEHTYAGGSGLAIRSGTASVRLHRPGGVLGSAAEGGQAVGGQPRRLHAPRGTRGPGGGPKPDISSPEKLKNVLLAARSVSTAPGRAACTSK
jgi:hypothetical protein